MVGYYELPELAAELFYKNRDPHGATALAAANVKYVTYDKFAVFGTYAIRKKIRCYTQKGILPGQVAELTCDHVDGEVISSLK